MTAPISRFQTREPADNARLVREHPFAWVISADDPEHGARLHATPLPLQARADAQGRITGIVGHFARRNPHVEALQRQPHALFLFLGPHGYVSPSWMADRTQAPTWNHASLQCRGAVRLIDDPGTLSAQVRALVDAQEQGRPRAWSVDDMGERYARLARGIVGFEVDVDEAQGYYKLGQDERDDVFADILRGLAQESIPGPAESLRSWMLEFARNRGT